MSVLVGLIRPDGVALLADRAAFADGQYLTAGTPWPLDDVTKIFASTPADGAGIIGGIVGKKSSPGVDLAEAMQHVLDRSDGVRQASSELATLFDSEVGDDLRAHAGFAATPSTPFGEPVITVALLGGRTRNGFVLTAVGLLAAGGARSVDLKDSVVYAPSTVQPDAELLLLGQDPSSSIEQARNSWPDHLRDLNITAIRKQRVYITSECDHATISDTAATGVIRLSPPPIPPTPYA